MTVEASAVPAVRMTMTPGTWRPTEVQELVLTAALDRPDRAVAAFDRWVATTDFDDVDAGSYRILPLIATRFDALGITSEWSAHLRGILRRSWYENQLLVHRTVPAVDALQAAGIDVITLKGAPLGVLAYPTMGARPMDDLDLLVPEDRAVDALRVLLDRGWQPDAGGVPPSMLRGEMSEAFRRIRHSTGLRGPEGFDIDLHWHATFASCWPGADRGLWSSKRPLELGGRSLSALSAHDELVVACVHGIRANLIAPIRWVTDSMLLMRDQSFDWDAVVARARELVVEPLLVLPLTYLRDRYEAPIPAWVLAALAQRRAGYLEQEWLESRMELGEKRTVAAHYGGYLRTAYADHGVQRYVGGLPGHLSALLGCSSSKELPGEVVRRGAGASASSPEGQLGSGLVALVGGDLQLLRGVVLDLVRTVGRVRRLRCVVAFGLGIDHGVDVRRRRAPVRA